MGLAAGAFALGWLTLRPAQDVAPTADVANPDEGKTRGFDPARATTPLVTRSSAKTLANNHCTNEDRGSGRSRVDTALSSGPDPGSWTRGIQQWLEEAR